MFIFVFQQRCRRLICPYAQVPVYGKCKQVVEKTHGLSMEIQYTLSVVWSRTDYILTDDMAILLRVGHEIIQEVKRRYIFEESGPNCPFCYQELRFIKEIFLSNWSQSNSTSGPNEENNYKRSNYTEPNFILSFILYTKDNCQLPNLMQNAVNFAGSEIEIIIYGTTAMLLHLELLTENVHSLLTGSKLILGKSTGPEEKCPVTYKLRTKSICPKINISVTDFDHLWAERKNDIINSMFTSESSQSKWYKEMCIDDYLERISNFDSGILRNSGSFKIRIDGVSVMIIIGITYFLLMKA